MSGFRYAGIAALALCLTVGAQPSARAAGPSYDWLQFNGDPEHSGNNTSEKTVSAGNVGTLTRQFHVPLPAPADGAPAFLSAVATSSGAHDIAFLTTKDGHILALDAHTGATIWSRQYGPGTCRINGGASVCFTTSSPAIDPARAYVYSYGLDGFVHKYAVGDGTEVMTGGWPELATNKGFNEKGSSALAIAVAANGNAFLYITSGGYPGDNGDYQGHLTAIHLADGSQRVFNTLCSDQTVHFAQTPATPDCASVQSAIWARAGAVYEAQTDEIFVATGNGTFAPASHDWGDSVLALHPDGTGVSAGPLDAYTPTNFAQLQSGDIDLGSTAPAILPTPANSNVHHLAVQSGKDGLLRLLNLDNLSGQGGPGHTGGNVGALLPVPQGGGVFAAPAVWVNPSDSSTWVFVGNGNGISGLKLAIDGSGNPSLATMWQSSTSATSPIVANGVLYCASSDNIRALAPTTGIELWHDTQIGSIHWESPVVANGTLYITDESGFLSAYVGPAAPVPAVEMPWIAWLAAGLLASGIAMARRRPYFV